MALTRRVLPCQPLHDFDGHTCCGDINHEDDADVDNGDSDGVDDVLC